MSSTKSYVFGGLPKAGDLAPELTPEPGPAGERVSLHGWTLEVEFNDHPSIPSLAHSLPSLTPSLAAASASSAAAQNHILGFKDLASVARGGEERGGEETPLGDVASSGPRWANSAPREESRK